MTPQKMKIINADEIYIDGSYDFNSLPLEDNYVVYLKGPSKIAFHELLSFTKTMGEPLIYDNKEYYTFDTIDVENELHYDGISSDGVRPIPDWLIFYLEEKPDVSGGEFRALNCASVLNDIDDSILKLLRTTPLELYGLKYYFDPNPEPFDLSFSINTIVKENGVDILRLHLPTNDEEYFELENDYVYCKIDNFRLKFRGMSGPDTADIFSEIRKACFSKNNLLELDMQVGDILFMNNKYTFHGRKKSSHTTSRKMHRIQIMCEKN